MVEREASQSWAEMDPSASASRASKRAVEEEGAAAAKRAAPPLLPPLLLVVHARPRKASRSRDRPVGDGDRDGDRRSGDGIRRAGVVIARPSSALAGPLRPSPGRRLGVSLGGPDTICDCDRPGALGRAFAGSGLGAVSIGPPTKCNARWRSGDTT